MKFSDTYGRYETMLRQLHALNAADKLDSPEADDLRDKMDVRDYAQRRVFERDIPDAGRAARIRD
jgi:hypothetical protein